MKNKSIKSKVISGVLLASMVISMGSIASAKNLMPMSKNTNKICAHKNDKMKKDKMKKDLDLNKIKTKLDGLVKSGTITQEQEDKIINYMKQKQEERKAEMDKISKMTEDQRKAYFEQNKPEKGCGLLQDLVNQKVISQSQADAISKVLPQERHKGNPNKFKNDKMKPFGQMKCNFDKSVKSGTITQEQEDKIVNYMKQKQEERKAEMDKISKMTEDQRKAYFEQNKPERRPDFLKDLVAQKIISQAQADTISKELPNRPMKH